MDVHSTPLSGPGAEVFYGTGTDETGHGVRSPQVELWAPGTVEKGSGPLVVFTSGSDGAYHQRTSLPSSNYTLTFQVRVRERRHEPPQGVYVRPGRSYRIDVHAKRRGFFCFFPISSY